jgi:hypothetical protein
MKMDPMARLPWITRMRFDATGIELEVSDGYPAWFGSDDVKDAESKRHLGTTVISARSVNAREFRQADLEAAFRAHSE